MTNSPGVGPVALDGDWEVGGLGESEQHVRKSTPERENAADRALQLQMISIRMHKDLLDSLKLIAKFHRVGYQPMIRDVLGRWARAEVNTILEQHQRESAAKAKLEKIAAKRDPADQPPQPARQRKRA